MDNSANNNIMQSDLGTKQRKVAITISENADGAELEVHVMVKPDVWVSGTKLTDAEFEENKTLLLFAAKMISDVASQINLKEN
jgi:hypothetical protein